MSLFHYPLFGVYFRWCTNEKYVLYYHHSLINTAGGKAMFTEYNIELPAFGKLEETVIDQIKQLQEQEKANN
jgi:hypothetical protein